MLHLSSRVYHNIIGATLVLWVFLLINYYRKNAVNALIIVLFCAVLPWLHFVYLAFCLTLFVLFVFTYKKEKKIVWTAFFFLALDALVLFVYRTHLHGGIHLIATVNNYQLTPWIHRTLLALLFDQECGLFFIAPYYIFFISGFVVFIKDKSYRFIGKIIFLFSGFLILQGSSPAFGGGYVPGRLLVPALPFIAIFLRRYFENIRIGLFYFVIIFISIALAYLMITIPWLAINYEIGRNFLVTPLLSRYLPSFLVSGKEHYFMIMVFLMVMVVSTYSNTKGKPVLGS